MPIFLSLPAAEGRNLNPHCMWAPRTVMMMQPWCCSTILAGHYYSRLCPNIALQTGTWLLGTMTIHVSVWISALKCVSTPCRMFRPPDLQAQVKDLAVFGGMT